jgi:hypothetical protein
MKWRSKIIKPWVNEGSNCKITNQVLAEDVRTKRLVLRRILLAIKSLQLDLAKSERNLRLKGR